MAKARKVKTPKSVRTAKPVTIADTNAEIEEALDEIVNVKKPAKAAKVRVRKGKPAAPAAPTIADVAPTLASPEIPPGLMSEEDVLTKLREITGNPNLKALDDVGVLVKGGAGAPPAGKPAAKPAPSANPQLLGQMAASLGRDAGKGTQKAVLGATDAAGAARALAMLFSEGKITEKDMRHMLSMLPSTGDEQVFAGSAANIGKRLERRRFVTKGREARDLRAAQTESGQLPTQVLAPGATLPPEPSVASVADRRDEFKNLFSTMKPTRRGNLRRAGKYGKSLGSAAVGGLAVHLLFKLLNPESERDESLAKNQFEFERGLIREAGESVSTEQALEDLQNRKAEMARMAMMGQINPKVFKMMEMLRPGSLTKNERSYIPDPALSTLAGGGLQALIGAQ